MALDASKQQEIILSCRQTMSKTPGVDGGERVRIETKQVVRNANN